ncbi:hypothetical protein GCM10017786_11280 [Amycolatopsis deserti]|uniref:ClpX-type ZB domain-containing protein n=1 Tax=Amycolatopsis deserti TaxID=185696 RepID=A0ABQ3IKY3_9PSEU|nr:hypothetical protein [Amycolatopsis deserti]GHE82237.1 hypothetical protein GCM10017786_11280 [Amycolatopsis deserti]
MMRCRFCDTPPAAGEARVPGPAGPICARCVETGLGLVRDGRPRTSRGGTELDRIRAGGAPCEFCDRTDRRSFFGFTRGLRRMRCAQTGAVICDDCLDHSGNLLNQALRHV